MTRGSHGIQKINQNTIACNAENRTVINRIYHLDRGYEYLENKLKNCKAKVIRV